MAKKAKKEEAPPPDAAATSVSPLQQSVAAAIDGMIYISESEAPLELEAWPDATDAASLQAKIANQYNIPLEAQTLVPPDEFLSAIQQMVDPSDPVMVDYASRYGKLFMLLKADGGNMVVIRAAGEQLHIFIGAFSETDYAIIHTTAVET